MNYQKAAEKGRLPGVVVMQCSTQNGGGYISKPVLCRGDDGLCGRVDRLKALGNAVVPQVAAIPLARVIEIERAQRTDNPATYPRSVQQG